MMEDKVIQLQVVQYRRGGFYKLLQRGTKCLMYERLVRGKRESIEVFMIKIRKVNFKNCIIPKRETFPHDEAFGRWAWCFTSLERALAKFELIENN